MKYIANKIKIYKELKADIVYIDLEIEDLEENFLGVQAQPTGEKTGSTNKFNSVVENQFEKLQREKEKLQREKRHKEREIKKIDNALSILTKEEREIINEIYIEHKKYKSLEIKFDRTYQRIKQIETEALKKIEKYLE